MSRIQQILEKAEREGATRRVRPQEPGAQAFTPAEPVIPANFPPPMLVPPLEPAPSPLTAPPPARIVEGAHLDRRLIVATSADTVAAEQYRALRTRILHADNGAPTRVVLITSPARGDGRTITAANLALTMAQEPQRRVCLVEADLRHPQLQQLFGLPDGPGLSEVLAGTAELDDALLTLEEHQITILPAGRVPAHPAELLGTTAMRRLLESLRSQYEKIVIDAPATLPLADVGILTPLADSVLMVVRAGVTSKPSIHEAIATIEAGKLLGIVLNEAGA